MSSTTIDNISPTRMCEFRLEKRMRIIHSNRIYGIYKAFIVKAHNWDNVKFNFAEMHCAFNSEISCFRDGSIIIKGLLKLQSNAHLVANGGSLQIGKGCGFNRNDIVISMHKITIGNNCAFGPNVCIYDHDHAFDANGIIKGNYKCDEIIIGDNVWVGAGVIILRGSHIGQNCKIGAGCVIKGDIPENSIVTMDRRMIVNPLNNV